MNNIKRKISISFIIYMFIAVLCGCRDNQYDVNANEGVQLKEIIIGSDIQPPFNYVDSDRYRCGACYRGIQKDGI